MDQAGEEEPTEVGVAVLLLRKKAKGEIGDNYALWW